MSVTVLPTPVRARGGESPQSISDAIQRLKAEAQAKAREHSLMLEAAIAELESLAQEIADGGEPYLGGVREAARRLAPQLTNARTTLEAILGRKEL